MKKTTAESTAATKKATPHRAASSLVTRGAGLANRPAIVLASRTRASPTTGITWAINSQKAPLSSTQITLS